MVPRQQQMRRPRELADDNDDQAISQQAAQPAVLERLGLMPRTGAPTLAWTASPAGEPGSPEQPAGDDGQAGPDGQLSWAGQLPADSVDLPAGEPFREISDGMAITPTITVVLPVLNEAANLPLVFASLPSLRAP